MTHKTDPKELFTTRPDVYAKYRPRYPKELYAYLADLAPSDQNAWDCGTGSGQVATDLTDYFTHIVATDVSDEQLAYAPKHAQITYKNAPAEASGLDDYSIDLITVACALHWFDRPRFYKEAQRVLRPGGVLAVWSYGTSILTPEQPAVTDIVRRFSNQTLAPYWSAGNELTDNQYETVELPLEPIDFPELEARKQVDLDGLKGYLRSWSASQKYFRQRGEDPIDHIADELAEAWGPSDTKRELRWPLFGRIGRAARSGSSSNAPNP